MEDRPAFTYCPKCQATQPTFPFTEASRLVHRCQVCGFVVERSLVLETAEVIGLPSPPDVKILCVDDDPAALELNEHILRSQGYSVLTAMDGPTALEVAAREHPAFILLDIMMPMMDGFEVCRRLKADPGLKAIPVIILTAIADPQLNLRAFEAGAELALQKPAEPATVLRTIEVALALAAARTAEPASAVAPQVVTAPTQSELTEHEPEAEPDLAVPTCHVPLMVWTADGATLHGQIFLRSNVETHTGPETVQDRLNDANLFVSLSVPGDAPLVFLNKTQVIRVEVPEEAWPPDLPDAVPGVRTETIQVQLINGEQFSGTVRIEGPTGASRLSDFLNAQPAFLPLRSGDRLHFLHKRFIARIVPQPAGTFYGKD